MINGIINVYKEGGYTSFDVVAKLRGITKIRKIGHTGTLDPDAVGVLPVCIGSATKLCDLLTDKTKEYEASMKLGLTTDTQDISGEIISEKEVNITRKQFEEAIMSFVGRSGQIPPMYSAIKINGKKLYELARAGMEVERQAREIEIYAIDILDMSETEAVLRINCSKGTYIRTLCNDIGEKLGCGAVMTSLKRTRSGDFYIKDAHTLSQIEELQKNGALESIVKSVDTVFSDYPSIEVSGENNKRVVNGNQLNIPKTDDRIRVYLENGTFAAVYEYSQKNKCYTPFKMFLG